MTNRVNVYRNNPGINQKLITQSSASTLKSIILDEKSPMNNLDEPNSLNDHIKSRI